MDPTPEDPCSVELKLSDWLIKCPKTVAQIQKRSLQQKPAQEATPEATPNAPEVAPAAETEAETETAIVAKAALETAAEGGPAVKSRSLDSRERVCDRTCWEDTLNGTARTERLEELLYGPDPDSYTGYASKLARFFKLYSKAKSETTDLEAVQPETAEATATPSTPEEVPTTPAAAETKTATTSSIATAAKAALAAMEGDPALKPHSLDSGENACVNTNWRMILKALEARNHQEAREALDAMTGCCYPRPKALEKRARGLDQPSTAKPETAALEAAEATPEMAEGTPEGAHYGQLVHLSGGYQTHFLSELGSAIMASMGIITQLLQVVLVGLLRLLGNNPRYPTEKRVPSSGYECGFSPFAAISSSSLVVFRQLAVYFVVFEAELVFLYPWSASLLPGSLLGSALGYYGVVPFLACLVVGFALEIQRDALKL
jgi:NADH-quinone oxidoreductase subunit A